MLAAGGGTGRGCKMQKRRNTRSQSVNEKGKVESQQKETYRKVIEPKNRRQEDTGRKEKNKKVEVVPEEEGSETEESKNEVVVGTEDWLVDSKESAMEMLQFFKQLTERDATRGILKDDRARMSHFACKITDIIMMYEGAVQELRGQIKVCHRETAEMNAEIKLLKNEKDRDGGQRDNESSKEVKKMVKENTRSEEVGIRINKVKKVPKRLLIDCRNKEDIEHIKRVVASKMDGPVPEGRTKKGE